MEGMSACQDPSCLLATANKTIRSSASWMGFLDHYVRSWVYAYCFKIVAECGTDDMSNNKWYWIWTAKLTSSCYKYCCACLAVSLEAPDVVVLFQTIETIINFRNPKIRVTHQNRGTACWRSVTSKEAHAGDDLQMRSIGPGHTLQGFVQVYPNVPREKDLFQVPWLLGGSWCNQSHRGMAKTPQKG